MLFELGQSSDGGLWLSHSVSPRIVSQSCGIYSKAISFHRIENGSRSLNWIRRKFCEEVFAYLLCRIINNAYISKQNNF